MSAPASIPYAMRLLDVITLGQSPSQAQQHRY
ncbi:hypothetical protein SNOG_15539 [Parastagonospora nodorum SN15]|uniref:Uncharacterized protein n=1 Tax=Phaeosphaeria nodorum (strain SN15 / ATCC MYA-4574 / FGSC 10173) TaxID=321614 RepID=Q0TYJ4_PHANO|nr:hypothetical protein SNOG_15539 [Parastagonospora nodorum SN15]EAT77204.1 hypothetical protein SNOG_15539 [Parastagonospora nodorum SN15]